jgi:ABC-type glycerol-3-phosphate transport system substrate-binding protein
MAWLSGKVAMTDLCTCDLPTYGAVKAFSWSAVATPRGPKRLVTVLNPDFGAIVAAEKGNKNTDAAWQVLKGFLIDPGNERKFSYDSLRGVPALKVNSGVFFDAVKRNYPNLDASILADGITYGTPMSELWYPAYNELGGAVSPIFDKVMAGETTAAEAAPQAVAAGQKAVDDWFRANKLPTS